MSTDERDQQTFLTRGLASAENARRTGRYVPAVDVLTALSARLAGARSPRKPR